MTKDIKGYEGLYQIDLTGNVYSLDRLIMTGSKLGGTKKGFLKGKILKPGLAGNGYYTVSLRKNGKSKTHCIHRLLAEAFIENNSAKKEVNHIDGNRKNNCLTNLEWVTPSENQKHRWQTYKHSSETVEKIVAHKRKRVIDLNGCIYQSAKEAAIRLKINPSTLRGQLCGNYKNKTGLKYL